MNRIRYEDYDRDSTIPELEIGPIAHMDLVRYSGASGDFNPIHTDPEFARSVGLDGTIVHGMYIMALVGRLCSNWAHPAQIKSYAVKFRDMTRPDQKIVCRGTVKKKYEADGEKLLQVAVEARGDDDKVKLSGELIVSCD